MTHTFFHLFKNGTTALATVRDDPPGYDVEWSRLPISQDMYPEYLQWRDTIMKEFTERTGKTVLVIT